MGCRAQVKPGLSAWENREMPRVGSGDVTRPAGLLGALCGQGGTDGRGSLFRQRGHGCVMTGLPSAPAFRHPEEL